MLKGAFLMMLHLVRFLRRKVHRWWTGQELPEETEIGFVDALIAGLLVLVLILLLGLLAKSQSHQ